MRSGMRESRLCVPREVILDPYKSAQESSNELDFPLPRPLCSATPRVDTIEARSLQLQHPFQEVR